MRNFELVRERERKEADEEARESFSFFLSRLIDTPIEEEGVNAYKY